MNFMKLLKFALAGMLFVCANALAADNDLQMTPYTEDKPVVTVISTQPEFVIKLKSNPTTGYSWFLREYDSALLQPVKHSFEANTNKKIMGAPGFELWTFRAKPGSFVVPQQTSVRFIYSRPWEVDDGNTKQAIFKVTLEGAGAASAEKK